MLICSLLYISEKPVKKYRHWEILTRKVDLQAFLMSEINKHPFNWQKLGFFYDNVTENNKFTSSFST